MVVAVQRPSQKEDPLTTIMKGLQVAGGILDLKEKITKETPDPNKLTQKDLLTLEASGKLKQVPIGTEGATTVVGPQGKDIAFISAPPSMSPVEQARFGKGGIEERKLKESQLANELKEKEISEKKRQTDLNIAADEKTKFISDKKISQDVDKFETAQRVKALLAQERPVLDQVALRQIFRLSGDVGAIRAEDLEQLGASPALVDRALLMVGKLTEGQTIADQERADLAQMVKVMEQFSRTAVRKRAGEFADILAKRTSLNRDEAFEYLNPDGQLTELDWSQVQPIQNIGQGPVRPENKDVGVLDRFGTAFGSEPKQVLTGDDAINNLLGQ